MPPTTSKPKLMKKFSDSAKAVGWPAVGVAAVLVACGVALWRLNANMNSADQARALLELWKTVLNLGLIVIVGGFVSFLYRRFEKRRVVDRALHGFRADYLRKFQGAYRTIKTVRRTLRAAGLTTMRRDPLTELDEVHILTYREQMALLNEAQLDFEDLFLELENFPDAFSNSVEIEEVVKRINSYLREILREYENHWRRLGGTTSGRSSFESLERLRDFTGSFKEGDYRKKVVWGRRQAIGLMQSDLLPLRLAQEGA